VTDHGGGWGADADRDEFARRSRRAADTSGGGMGSPETSSDLYDTARLREALGASRKSDGPADRERHADGHLDLRAPRELEDLGVSYGLLLDLALKRALQEGRTSTLKLSKALSLNPMVVERIVEELRKLRYVEIEGLEGRDYQLILTEAGRDHATSRATLSRYAGACPVSLDAYQTVVLKQRENPRITRETMKSAFSDLVVGDPLLDSLGPALLARGAMFLYGPPGTGKTSIAERLNRVTKDLVLVPKAVEIDGQIIVVFDPILHEAANPQPKDLDPRWVLCKRPAIVAGGELKPSQLDLVWEPNNGIYLAPLQMQANNGVLVIDDFGRQLMTPAELLNRWIVPLDRNIDFLSLGGVKFEVPFEVKVVLSTNLEPSSLGDEAFFRRIQNKILISSVDEAQFDLVLERCAASYGVLLTEDSAEQLRSICRGHGDGDLRPYVPGEICKLARAVCEYKQEPLVLTPENLEAVAAIFFTRELDTSQLAPARRAEPTGPKRGSLFSSMGATPPAEATAPTD
jgi:hypothetical protein